MNFLKKQLEEKSNEISNAKMIDYPLVAYDNTNYHAHLDRLDNKMKYRVYDYLSFSCH